ncbi:hypothetical protein EUTSA_v10001142mg, partial [Eutrema salsugineum]
FDNRSIIKGYSRTLIGRCMNPQMQDMKALLYMPLRIWKLEDRVAGADLGMGKFQFDFEKEEDIKEVMKMEPFHFDYWMVSLVRWSPVVDPQYPSAIKFWADVTFESIGKALGKVEAVNLDEGKIQVTIDGFKPLVLETTFEFDGGEETTVYLRYERLFGFCKICQSLCHDSQRCPTRIGMEDRWSREEYSDEPANCQGPMSYKAAAKYGGNEGKEVLKNNGGGTDSKQYKGRSERKYGEGSSQTNRPSNHFPPKEHHKRRMT